MITTLTRTGSALAAAATAHSVVNSFLLRRPEAPAALAPIPTPTTARAAAAPASAELPLSGPRASILIPARDEVDRIGACVAAACGQTVGVEVLVLDDGSTDGTAAAAKEAGATVYRGEPPPEGWLGKPHACARLAALADPASSALVFVDADVVLSPHAVAAALDLLDRADLDLVSPYPRQLAGSPLERLVQPLLQWSILTFVPLRIAERSRRGSLAVANGQFLVVRRDAYERAGGHTAVAADVLDDLALARAVRRAGGRGGIADGTDLATCRMYRDGRELADGYAKSLWQAFGSPAGAAATMAVLGLMYVLPPLAVIASRGARRAGLLGYAAAVAGRLATGARTGARLWPDALAHPLSVLALGTLTARSHHLHRRGTLRWKSRALPARALPARARPAGGAR